MKDTSDPIKGLQTSVRFGPFEVNLRSGELIKSGREIRLQKKSFDVLAALLEHPGEIVTREELQAKLWPGDTFVDFEDNLNTAVNRLRLALNDSAEKPQFIETLRGRGYRLTAALSKSIYEIKPPMSPSIAVLPFANIGNQPDQDYLCDGLAEEITNALSHLQGLCVVARTSAYAFKGTMTDVREIARKLDVSAVLEGSVQNSGNRLRITVQLINAADGLHLWSDRFECNLGDVFAIEDVISQAVTRKMKSRLLHEDQSRLLKRQTRNPAAYDLYLRGRYTLVGRTPHSTANAMHYFEQSIHEDPHYAPARTALAECYCQSGFMGYMDPRKAFPKALEDIRRALDLDSLSADAHALLGWANWAYNWDWRKSEQCFLRAEELAPNSELARQWHSLLLSALGRFDEALAQVNYARRLDPLSLVVQTVHGIVLYYGKEIDLAVEQYRDALDADPSVQIVYFHLGRACLSLGKYEEAVAQLEKAPIGFPMARAMLGAAYAKTGRRDKTIEILEELTCLSGQRYVGPLAFAVLHRGLGDINTALDLYDKAFTARDGFVPFLNVDPIVEDLRTNPDFKALLQKLQLP